MVLNSEPWAVFARFSIGACDTIAKVLITNGFLNGRQLNRHFSKHGSKFAAVTAEEYEGLADKFLGEPKASHVHQCKRGKGDVVRFDPVSDEYGVIDSNGTIRTYYKPVPCASLASAPRRTAMALGDCHRQLNNTDYFRSECKKW